MGLLESLDVYPKKARVSGSKRRVNKTINAGTFLFFYYYYYYYSCGNEPRTLSPRGYTTLTSCWFLYRYSFVLKKDWTWSHEWKWFDRIQISFFVFVRCFFGRVLRKNFALRYLDSVKPFSFVWPSQSFFVFFFVLLFLIIFFFYCFFFLSLPFLLVMSHTSHLQERSPTSIGLLFLQSCLNICLWSLKSLKSQSFFRMKL